MTQKKPRKPAEWTRAEFQEMLDIAKKAEKRGLSCEDAAAFGWQQGYCYCLDLWVEDMEKDIQKVDKLLHLDQPEQNTEGE